MSNSDTFLRPRDWGFDVYFEGVHIAKVVESPAAPEYSIIDRQGERVGAPIPNQRHLVGPHLRYLIGSGKLQTTYADLERVVERMEDRA